MSRHLGYRPEDSTVVILFTTSDGNGGAVAPSSAFEAADIIIYKDGSATQKSTTNGITMTSPFDSITGLHQVSIDTSNDTGDAGFWAAGSYYDIVLSPDETVDSQTVVSIIGSFDLGPAENLDAILADTAEIGAAGAGLSDIPWNPSWDADVQSEVSDALIALGLDHLISTNVNNTDVADNSIIAKLVSSSATADFDDFDNTQNSLQAIGDPLNSTIIEVSTSNISSAIDDWARTTIVPDENVSGTIMDAFQASLVEAKGRQVRTGKNWTKYKLNGKVYVTFVLDDPESPSARTPKS